MPVELILPHIGSTRDPEWSVMVLDALQALAEHVHNGEASGSKLLPSSIDFENDGFDFNQRPQVNAAYYDVIQGPLPAQTEGHGRLACDNDGNLYYVSPNANVKLATSGAIAYSAAAKGFVGDDYGVVGGSAMYNAASPGYPFASTFYFYTPTVAPSTDPPGAGWRAGIACGLVDIKGQGDYAGVYHSVSSGAKDRFYEGIIAGFSGKLTWGVKTQRDATVGGGTPFATALSLRETDGVSAIADNAAGSWRTYGLHVNGGDNATADSTYHFTVRANLPNFSGTSIANVSYTVRNHTDMSGAPSAVGTGFGFRHVNRLQSADLGSYGKGVPANALLTSWSDLTDRKGRYAVMVGHQGIIQSMPAIDAVAIDATKMSVAIGMEAVTHSPHFSVAQDSYLFGKAYVYQTLSVVGGGFDATGLATLRTGAEIRGGDCTLVDGSLVLQSDTQKVQAPSVLPTKTATTPATGGGLFKNNQVLAWARIEATGAVGGQSFNVTSVTKEATAGHYRIVLTQPVGWAAAIITASTDDAVNGWSGYGVFSDATNVTVRTRTLGASSTAFADVAFYFVAVGSPP